jgi:hypothetical protein
VIVAGAPARVRVQLQGEAAELPGLEARSFLGRYEVLLDEENPLVTSLMAEPAISSPFAPARVLSGLLGYRVSAMSFPAER